MTSDENVRNTAIFQIRAYACVEARRLVLGYPCAEYFFLTLHVDAEYGVNAFAHDPAVLSGVEDYSVEEDNRIDLLERSVLPLVDLWQYLICDFRDHSLRDI